MGVDCIDLVRRSGTAGTAHGVLDVGSYQLPNLFSCYTLLEMKKMSSHEVG